MWRGFWVSPTTIEVAGYAQLAFPLYRLTGKKPFLWGQEQQAAFDAFNKTLTSPPVLGLLTPDGEFVIVTDALAEAIGAELSQIQDGQERPIAYRSLSLSAAAVLHNPEGAVGRGVFYTHVPALPVGSEIHCAYRSP